MLTRVRIEVQEDTAEACVEALSKYEHAIQQQEARRYRDEWPVTVTVGDKIPATKDQPAYVATEESDPADEYPTPDQPWEDGLDHRGFFNDHFGREITEEVIEFDATIPGYNGRRVIAFNRVDTRSFTFLRVSGLDLTQTMSGAR